MKKSRNYQNGKIYKITNSLNDKIYIGSTTVSLTHRFNHHIRRLKESYNGPLYVDMKDNFEKFEIILLEKYPCSSYKELCLKEFEYINKFINENGREKLYNKQIVFNGEGHHKYGIKNSDETRKKLSISHTGEKHNFYGTHRTEDTKNKIKKSRLIYEANKGFRGAIREREYHYEFRYYEILNDDLEKKMKWKSFNFNVYSSKENAYKAMIDFQNTIYPINNNL